MGLTSKAFSDIITFSRSSNATRVGPDGKIAYAPHNLLTYSEQFDNAAWTKNAATVTANAIAAPNGTVTADKFAEDTANDAHYLDIRPAVTAGKSTMSIYVKAAGRTRFQIREGTNGEFVSFDLNNLSGNIVSVGNGWYRCWLTATPVSTTFIYQIRLLNDAGTLVYTGDGSSGLYVWGAQVSIGSIAGDYTPTTSAAVYGPRFDYDPVTLAAKGLLIEEQRTNVATYSEAFDNAAWTKGNSSISANAVTAPDGTTTADKLVEDTATTGHVAYQSFVGSAASYTASVFVKSAGRSLIAIRFDDASTLSTSYFDLSTGTVAASGTGATCSITPMGNGWYRCSVTRTLTVATYYFLLSPALTTSSNSYTGDGSSGLYLWGAQIEAGAFATSYIPTVASTVTRSADVVSVNTLSPWFNAVEGTLFAQFDEYISSSSITNQVFASLNDGTANNEMLLYRSGGGFDARFAILTSGALQADVATSITIAQNTAYKTAGAYKLNDIAASTSGNTPGTDTSATIPTVSALQIGGGRSTTAFSGHLRRLAYYPRRLTNAELQALTA